MIVKPKEEVQLVFDLVMKRGNYDYSEMTKSAIFAEASTNPKLKNLALLYLVATSQRAELMLERLTAEIDQVFFSQP